MQYTFDAEGKRIASSASGRARYDAGSLYAELNGANQVIRRHHTSAPNRAASHGWMQRAAATLTLFLSLSDPGGASTQHFHHLHDALNTRIATTPLCPVRRPRPTLRSWPATGRDLAVCVSFWMRSWRWAPNWT